MQNLSALCKLSLVAASCATLMACGGGSDDSGGGGGGGGSDDGTTTTQTQATSPYKLYTAAEQATNLQVTNTVVTVTKKTTGEVVSRTRTLSLDGKGTLTTTDDWKTITPASGSMSIAKGVLLLNENVVAWCSRAWGEDATHVATRSVALELGSLKGRTLRAYNCTEDNQLQGNGQAQFQDTADAGLQIVTDDDVTLVLSAAQFAELASGSDTQVAEGRLRLLAQTPPGGGKAIAVVQITPPLGSGEPPFTTLLVED